MTEPFTEEDKKKVRGCLGVLVVMLIVAAAVAYKGARIRGPLDSAASAKCADRVGHQCSGCCSTEGAKSSDVLRQGDRFVCQCFQ